MTPDKFINFYINQVEKEKARLRESLIESQNISIEELRRTQGIHEGLQKALNLLEDSLEKDSRS